MAPLEMLCALCACAYFYDRQSAVESVGHKCHKRLSCPSMFWMARECPNAVVCILQARNGVRSCSVQKLLDLLPAEKGQLLRVAERPLRI